MVTFKHAYRSRITPELRRFLQARGCKPLEYVAQAMKGSGTLSFTDGWKLQSGEEIEAAEADKKRRHRQFRQDSQCKQERERAAAFEAVPGLMPSSFGDFQIGDKVYVFDVHERCFVEAAIKAKHPKARSFAV